MKERSFPLSPRSCTDMRIGDVWAVPLPDGGFGAAQVFDLQPRARAQMVAGVLDWSGPVEPAMAELDGLDVLIVGLLRIEAFTEYGVVILGNTTVGRSVGPYQSMYAPLEVGSKTYTFGWARFPQSVAEALATR